MRCCSPWIEVWPIRIGPGLVLPLASSAVPAGFPSPAQEHLDEGLDLSRRFVPRPTSTFVVRAAGSSLIGLGILSGDYLVVDRSRVPRDGDVVIALVDGGFTAKRFVRRDDGIVLMAAPPTLPPIPFGEGCEIWGVVTSVHRDLLPGVVEP